MGRKPRIIAEGYPHHVVNRGHNGQVIFRSDFDMHIFSGLLSHYLEKTGCSLMAYCLMANHIHLMLKPEAREDLVELMHAVSFRYAMYFNQLPARKGALWESRYYSSIIIDEDYIWSAAKYICLNPVRAGIVDKPCDYRWSSSRDLMYGIKGEIPVADWIDDRQRPDFRQLLIDSVETETINTLVRHNQPYASILGLKELERLTGATT